MISADDGDRAGGALETDDAILPVPVLTVDLDEAQMRRRFGVLFGAAEGSRR
jgi:hypothetical protein